MHIGDKIQRLRRTRRLSQSELAEKAGVPAPVINRLEQHVRANVHMDVLKRLAMALGCTTDFLVGMHEPEEADPQTAEACSVAD